MPLAIVHSRALVGASAPAVTVEVHLGNGLPGVAIVGLPEAAVREARDRVRAAITTSGFVFPAQRITVNLAPADLPKASGRFDLPIALGILGASGAIPEVALADYEFAGELSLAGELRPIRGALAMTYHALSSRRGFVLPAACAAEASLVRNARVYPARTLLEVCAHLTGREPIGAVANAEVVRATPRAGGDAAPDLADVRGHVHAKRALEIAAAGRHSLLLVGPPGAGKSMLAVRMLSLTPNLTEQEALESAAMQSLGSAGFRAETWCIPPFRSPHHSASSAAIIGGGNLRPGEVSLAHHGILFLDELAEFRRDAIEALREPLETGRIAISRAARQAEFPAQFHLIAAMNPCPCGYAGHPSGRCRCAPDQITHYRGRISGPMLDRIDMHLEVPALISRELLQGPIGESSATVRARVVAARAVQTHRQCKLNAMLAPSELDTHCALAPAANMLLQRAMEALELSARGVHRVLKIARTIADLAAMPRIECAHLAEALQYRRRGSR